VNVRRCKKEFTVHRQLLLLVVLNIGLAASAAPADIFQWEYVNPADPSQGKRQSMTLVPDGAGASAIPGAELSGRNLTRAYLMGADLRGATFNSANFGNSPSALPTNLTQADLSNANLTDARLQSAILTDADLTDAVIRGAVFYVGYGLTTGQLYSTASYKARDLSGISLAYSDLAGWSFAGQNLTNASFIGAQLIGADFSGAEIRGAVFDRWPPGNYWGTGTGLTLAQLYSTASYQAHDLSDVGLAGSHLAGGMFAGQNLRKASFHGSNLTDADFTEADIRGASFSVNFNEWEWGCNPSCGGLTLVQLYSTATYQTKDLSGINLAGNKLAGANFAGQDLTDADLRYATLTDADFTDADVRGAIFGKYGDQVGITLAQLYSTASYEAHDLSRIGLWGSNLAGGNFAGQNLTAADMSYATLSDADFTGAQVRGTRFNKYLDRGTGITLAQLYSTASYRAQDLSGVDFGYNDLAGGNFAGQNLDKASFYNATLTGADFTQANLKDVSFHEANLTGADLTAADARGAVGLVFTGATTTNLIRGDGHIAGLNLGAGQRLVVREHDGTQFDPTTIPITVDHHLTMAAGGVLQLLFEEDDWGSTISFQSGIPITLSGTLELTFADGVDLASQVGRTFDLFDWTGVEPTGAFAVSSPFLWDVTDLYTTGEVTLVAVPEPSTSLLAMVPVALFGHRQIQRLSRKQSNRKAVGSHIGKNLTIWLHSSGVRQ
jgi:uncharacterized protein YjbI with pentapeptide repeats